jgi:lipid A oxidase
MAALLTMGWAGTGERGRDRRWWDIATTLAAALMITASSAASVLEQARVDNEPALAQRSGPGDGSRLAPGRETVIGAYSGAPYNYPSAARVTNPGGPGATDFTVDPVNWYTAPFKSPIYYGARVQRWFAGGRTGGMVDFIHSKAIAPLDEESGFTGTLDGQPLAPRARIADVFRKFEFSHGHNMLLFNGLVRLPGIGARISPYAGAGVGASLPHTEVELTNGGHPRTYEYNYAGPATQALLGVEIRLARVSFFVEYKFTYAHYSAPLSQVDGSWLPLDMWRQVKRWFAGEAPPGGHIATELAAHQIVSGLAVRLAPGQ